MWFFYFFFYFWVLKWCKQIIIIIKKIMLSFLLPPSFSLQMTPSSWWCNLSPPWIQHHSPSAAAAGLQEKALEPSEHLSDTSTYISPLSICLSCSVIFSVSLCLPVILFFSIRSLFSLHLRSRCAFLPFLPSLPIYYATDLCVLSCFISGFPTDLLSTSCFLCLLQSLIWPFSFTDPTPP